MGKRASRMRRLFFGSSLRACSTEQWTSYHCDPSGPRQSHPEPYSSVTGLHSRPVHEGTQRAITKNRHGERWNALPNFKGGSGVTSRFVIYSFLIGSNYSLPRLSSNLLPFCHNVGAVSIIPRTRYVAHHTKIPKAMIPSWYQRSFSFRKPGIDSNLWNSPLDHVEPDITGLRNPVELKMSQLCQTRIDVRYFLAHRLEVRIV